jgi:hypothetical protein
VSFEGKGSAKPLRVRAGRRHRGPFVSSRARFEARAVEERTSHFSTRPHRL